MFWIAYLKSRSWSYFIKILLIFHNLIEFINVRYVPLDKVIIALVESLGHQYVLITRVLSSL